MTTKVPEPARIARLEHDPRGYPIPWNVSRGVDGVPLFTVNDDRKDQLCLSVGLCPLCGERLGRWKWWVGGVRAAFDPHGWYLDRPGHMECVEFALQTCPYLAAPNFLPEHVLLPSESKLLPEQRLLMDWSMDHNRPPLFVAVCGDKGEVSLDLLRPPYTRPTRPVAEYRFWRHGQRLGAGEALPILRGVLGADFQIPAVREEESYAAR